MIFILEKLKIDQEKNGVYPENKRKKKKLTLNGTEHEFKNNFVHDENVSKHKKYIEIKN